MPLIQKMKGTQQISFGLVSDETDALHLTNIVESDDTDPCLRVSLLCLLHLSQDLGCISAPKHGQLPHGPVSAIVRLTSVSNSKQGTHPFFNRYSISLSNCSSDKSGRYDRVSYFFMLIGGHTYTIINS
uniref:Uncharacterized protein n=1 Tax=Solanum lycopersicum TaxID=4081 RepID=A0A3Q7F7Y6_SOLLC